MSDELLKYLARLVYATVKVLNKHYMLKPYTTTLQKVVYFVLASKDPGLCRRTYVPYLYGPYSADVAYVVDALNLAGFIDIEHEEWGRRFKLAVEDKKLREEEDVKQVAQQLEKLSDSIFEDVQGIALFAKVHWLASNYPAESPSDLEWHAASWGWHLDSSAIEHCLLQLKDARLYIPQCKSNP